MRRSPSASSRGFTLFELLGAMALGIIVLGGAAMLYSKGAAATYVVTQRSEMQLEVRAAENMLIKDLSMAGAGLPPGGVYLPTGTSTAPLYGCDQAKCYVGGTPPSGIGFQTYAGNPLALYWIMPGHQLGPALSANATATDVITVVYADLSFGWDDYTPTFTKSDGSEAKLSLVSGPLPVSPANQPSDPVVGLKTGDLVLFSGYNSSGAQITAVGEVTSNVTGTAAPYLVEFASPDALGFNQPNATSNNLKAFMNSAVNTTTYPNTIRRIYMVSYYIAVGSVPGCMEQSTPCLLRQVSGHTPAPLAENIVNLQFLYDLYIADGSMAANQTDATGGSPNTIRKITLQHLTARSTTRGVQGYQGLDVQTEISGRDMSFKDRYTNTPNSWTIN